MSFEPTDYLPYDFANRRHIGPSPEEMDDMLAVVGAGLWVLYDIGLLTLDNNNLNTWLGLFVLSLVLGIGLSQRITRTIERITGSQQRGIALRGRRGRHGTRCTARAATNVCHVLFDVHRAPRQRTGDYT